MAAPRIALFGAGEVVRREVVRAMEELSETRPSPRLAFLPTLPSAFVKVNPFAVVLVDAARIRMWAATLISGRRHSRPDGYIEASRRLAELYSRLDGKGKQMVLAALPSLEGPGRAHALGWLRPLMIRAVPVQDYPGEAAAAVGAAAAMGAEGKALVRSLIDQARIQDPQARVVAAREHLEAMAVAFGWRGEPGIE